MSVINALDLSISFGENQILNKITFGINEKDKIGLVGANGVGKTTLFKIITGEHDFYTGTLTKSKNAKVGYMEQHTCSNSKLTVYDEMMTVFSELIKMEEEIEKVSSDIQNKNGDLNKNVERLEYLNEEFRRRDGLTYVSRARSALLGIGFDEKDFTMTTDKLSGGQRSKLCLTKLLLSGADLLLLDEPTNHLDIKAVEWLENFIVDFKGSVLLISHDRYFLDKVTNRTMEIHNGKLVMYNGNYSEFLKKKEKIQQDIRDKYNEDLKEIARIEAIVEQQRRWNREKNIKTAESKLKEIERIKERMVEPEKDVEKIRFDFSPKIVSGNDVLECEGLSKSFGEKKLFSNVDFLIKRKERVFLLGPNGCGKTTLLKILMGDYLPDSGKKRFGANVQTGYFDQVQEKLNMENDAISEVWNSFPYMTQTQIRNALAAFLFKGDEVYKKLSKCSGGERARIALLKLMLGKFNFLLLDEPTNHLDAFSREELEDTLLDYSGTMLIVSHDRYFINKLADRILYLTHDGIKEFIGNYDGFIQAQNDISQEIVKAPQKQKSTVNDYKLKKEIQSNIRKAKTRVSRLEEEIERLEAETAELEQSLQSEEVTGDYEKLMSQTAKLDELNAELENKLDEWEKANEQLNSLQEMA